MTDFMGDLFGGAGQQKPSSPVSARTAPEKGVQLRGHKCDGKQYVRAADVAELLKINGVLPKAASRLRAAASGDEA